MTAPHPHSACWWFLTCNFYFHLAWSNSLKALRRLRSQAALGIHWESNGWVLKPVQSQRYHQPNLGREVRVEPTLHGHVLGIVPPFFTVFFFEILACGQSLLLCLKRYRYDTPLSVWGKGVFLPGRMSCLWLLVPAATFMSGAIPPSFISMLYFLWRFLQFIYHKPVFPQWISVLQMNCRGYDLNVESVWGKCIFSYYYASVSYCVA